MKFHLIVLGCQMNESDAERLRFILSELGFTETEEKDKADFVLFVTCSVKQHAEDRVFGALEKIKKDQIVGITGCMARIPSTRSSEKRDKLFRRTKHIDLVFPIKEASKLPKLLEEFFPEIQSCHIPENFFETPPQDAKKTSAFVPISTGCNHFCTYCIVPHARGTEVCRPKTEILKECKEALEKGVQEITLLGQNVNRYAEDFATLLQEVADLGPKWLRFMSPHPEHLGEDVLQVMKGNANICPHLHLPVQSGSDTVLKRMARNYTREKFESIAERAKELIPELSLTTDIIVGFCGETKSEHEETATLCKKWNFDMIYLSKFSPRKGTVAAKWEDDVPLEEKKRRFAEINEILRSSSYAKYKNLIGKTLEVLIDKVDEHGIAKGHDQWNHNIFFPAPKRIEGFVGSFVEIEITEAEPFYVRGEMV